MLIQSVCVFFIQSHARPLSICFVLFFHVANVIPIAPCIRMFKHAYSSIEWRNNIQIFSSSSSSKFKVLNHAHVAYSEKEIHSVARLSQ